ncbi:hypothetical protein [Roseovarius indicus]|uniref:hypothetical protein n=1 Tax=Roseovarius indicus TaxID=540747 RepID=UPI00405A03C5
MEAARHIRTVAQAEPSNEDGVIIIGQIIDIKRLLFHNLVYHPWSYNVSLPSARDVNYETPEQLVFHMIAPSSLAAFPFSGSSCPAF